MKEKRKSKLWEWQERAKSGEFSCKCGEKRDLTVDHIVPVFFLEQLGLDKYQLNYELEENFELLCRYCNTRKACRLDVRHPKTYEIMRRVLDEAEKYYLINNIKE